MKLVSEMSQGELAAYIDTNLREGGIQVVLSGGACVAIYCDYKYVSKDLDFIAQFTIDRKKIASVMKEIGFDQWGKYYFHPDTPYFVEFISGPPSIGQEPIGVINELTLATGKIRLISPTDSVKDRLAAFYHWGDRQSLEQAVLVTKYRSIDLSSVELWSIREGKQEEFEEFKRKLEGK